MPSAAIYLRTSAIEPLAALSLAHQEAECRQLCEWNGWQVVGVFADNEAGGAPSERIGLQHLFTVCGNSAADIRYVVVHSHSRAGRSTTVLAIVVTRLAGLGVLLVAVDDDE